MALDPQIPLSVAQQPNAAQQMGQVYQLADAIEKHKEVQQQKQDQQSIQQYLKEGGNFNTPDGLAAAAEKLKGTVSPKTYELLTQAHSEMKLNDSKMAEYYAKMGTEVIDSQMKQHDFIAQNLEVPLETYNRAIEEKKSPEEALQAFEAAKVQVNQQIESMPAVNGKPVIDPQLRQRFMGMNPKEVQSALMGIKYHQEKLKSAAELSFKEAQIAKEQALEKKYLAEAKNPKGATGNIPDWITNSNLHGQEFLDLLPPGTQAQVRAIAEGRTQLSDIPARGGERARITQMVNQFDPAFTSMEYGADKASLTALSKDLTAIRPFGVMLDKNAEIAVELSKKAIKSDSRLANRSLNWISQNLGDNPDVAEFLAQTRIVQTEAARVLNNPRLVGQLSDTARIEMEHVVNGDMPMQSFERVIRRIQKDGQNRIQAMEEERARLLKQNPKSDEGAAPSDRKTGKSTVVPHETPKAPPAKNSKGWALHKDAKGKLAYVGPKGEIEEVK